MPVIGVGVAHLPQHVVAGVQQHRGVHALGQFGGDGDVVVVTVRADHGVHVPVPDRIDDRLRGVGGVDDHDVGVVTDQPDVVVDVPLSAVEGECSLGDDPLYPKPSAHEATT